MPLYEFRCQNCSTLFSILVKSINESSAAKCTACGSSDVARVISRFACHKSMETIWEESGEPKLHNSPDYYKDPRNIGRSTEKRFKEMGIGLPPQVQEKIQAAREGELPDSLKD